MEGGGTDVDDTSSHEIYGPRHVISNDVVF